MNWLATLLLHLLSCEPFGSHHNRHRFYRLITLDALRLGKVFQKNLQPNRAVSSTAEAVRAFRL
jgi:hypothetical protein